MWLWALVGCFVADNDVDIVPEDPEDLEAAALSKASTLAAEAAETLQTQMIQQMGNPGPEGAMVAGSAEADLWASHSPTSGVPGAKVGRSSARLRDPANQAPPWVQTWLDAHADHEFADVEGIRRIEETPEGPVARVIQPIPMLDSCVRCHGKSEQVPADVRTKLEARYPLDQALGYEVGDLRGALWAEVPVAAASDE